MTPAPQLDLFPDQPITSEAIGASAFDPPPDFVARIRGELEATLASVRGDSRLPWPDLTRTMLAELRFRSIARWLPAGEAASLRAAFEAEMARLYGAEDRRQGEDVP